MAKPNTKEDIAYRYVRELINSDDLQPGDLLPTETSISEKLGINRMTIAKALASLKNEGYVCLLYTSPSPRDRG